MHGSTENPVFLVGTTRSGTTLATLMLDDHPDIAFPGEFEWVFDFEDLDDAATGPRLEAYRDWLKTNRFFRIHDVEVDPALSFAELVRSFLAQMSSYSDAPHVGAVLHRHYARALEIWPDARFIHLVRDGRDVCRSWLRLGWCGNAYAGALRWTEALDAWERLRDRLPDDRWMEVRHEDLIREPRETLEAICEFIGTELHEDMFEYPDHSTYSAPDPSMLGRWRGRWHDRPVRIFEAFAGDHLRRYGYELSGLPRLEVSPTTERRLNLEARVRHNRARVEKFGVGLWLAEHVTRRVPVPAALEERVKLRMNEIVNDNLK